MSPSPQERELDAAALGVVTKQWPSQAGRGEGTFLLSPRSDLRPSRAGKIFSSRNYGGMSVLFLALPLPGSVSSAVFFSQSWSAGELFINERLDYENRLPD
jgi:hypothetical protein